MVWLPRPATTGSNWFPLTPGPDQTPPATGFTPGWEANWTGLSLMQIVSWSGPAFTSGSGKTWMLRLSLRKHKPDPKEYRTMCVPIPADRGLKLESVELLNPGPDHKPPLGVNPINLNPTESRQTDRLIPASTMVGSVTLMFTSFSTSQVLSFFQMNLAWNIPWVLGLKAPPGEIVNPGVTATHLPLPGKEPPAFAIWTNCPDVLRQTEVSLAKTDGKGFTTIVLVSELSQPLVLLNRYVMVWLPRPATTGSNWFPLTPVPDQTPPATGFTPVWEANWIGLSLMQIVSWSGPAFTSGKGSTLISRLSLRRQSPEPTE